MRATFKNAGCPLATNLHTFFTQKNAAVDAQPLNACGRTHLQDSRAKRAIANIEMTTTGAMLGKNTFTTKKGAAQRTLMAKFFAISTG
jgi:hypothetical protein